MCQDTDFLSSEKFCSWRIPVFAYRNLGRRYAGRKGVFSFCGFRPRLIDSLGGYHTLNSRPAKEPVFDAIINQQGDLLVVHFSEAVDTGQTGQCVELVRGLIAKAKPGFTIIADLGGLTHMDFECTKDLGVLMDIFNRAKVARICRVIPNPDVDIGWNILSRFHYDLKTVEIHTYPSFFQAMKATPVLL